MAMSGGANRRVGSTGEIRVHAQVISQDASRNESVVRVRGFMRATEGSSTSYGSADMSTSATSGGTRNWSGRSFSIQGSSWQEVVSHDHTVPHRADGTRPLTATFTLGPTGTSRFGSGGTVSVSFNVDRIAQVPSKPATPTVSNITSSGSRISWSAPASNGAAIEEYQWEVANSAGTRVDSGNTTSRSASHSSRAPNTDYQARVRAKNAAGWGPWSNFRSFTTKVASPDAPTNVDASRVNDGRATVTWTRRATSGAPYDSQRVQRRYWVNGAWSGWSTIATISGTATSYTDTSISANNSYSYRIQAVNSSGSAVSDPLSPGMRTTPAAPTNVAAVKRGADIRVTFENSFPLDTSIRHDVQDNPGGSGWVTVGSISDGGEFTHNEVNPAVSHQYRVRTVSTVTPQLTGPWSTASNVVQLLAPPLAPSLVGPLGVADRDAPVRLEFEHNPVDTTDQTAGQVRWRPAGGSWTTVSTGTDPFYDLPAPGTSGTFEWQARTRGEHASFGPWSPTWSFDAVSRPEVVIQSPQGTSDQSQAEVEWNYQNADGSGQSRWEAQLLDTEGSVLATGSGSNTATSHLFPTVLEDGTEYTVRVRARAGSGLWSEWDTSTFVTDFPLPYPVEVLPEWDHETGSVSITFQVDDSDATETVPDSVDVQRDDGDGWITIATGLDPETSIVDHTPRLAEIRYRTISRTTLPTARTGPETVTEPPRGLWPVFLNGGPDLGDVLAIYDNTKLAFGRGRAKTRRIWAGRDWPTTKWGQARSKTVALTATISPESPGATVADVEALEDVPSVVCVRDILGHKIFVTIDDVDSDVERDGRWNVSIPMTREHYIEGVR